MTSKDKSGKTCTAPRVKFLLPRETLEAPLKRRSRHTQGKALSTRTKKSALKVHATQETWSGEEPDEDKACRKSQACREKKEERKRRNKDKASSTCTSYLLTSSPVVLARLVREAVVDDAFLRLPADWLALMGPMML